MFGTTVSTQAQETFIPSFLDKGLGQILSPESESQTYASPSANELVPDSAEVGMTPLRGLSRLDPIPLPDEPLLAPQIEMPDLPAFLPQDMLRLDTLRPTPTLTFKAILSDDGDFVPNGLDWRLFSALPRIDGRLTLVASSSDDTARFAVPAGTYLLHVAFGRAGLAKRIDFTGVTTQETVVLNAGGLKLSAVTSDGAPCDNNRLRFDVYALEDGAVDDLVASNVAPQEILRLNAGDYRVVSRYGSVNATVTTEITVSPGELTEATLRHDAAVLTMKLVREEGGEALADTAWTVTTTSGDAVRESVGAFSTMVLAAGHYVVTARNREKVFQRAIEVKAGGDKDIEVLTSDLLVDDAEIGGTGDG